LWEPRDYSGFVPLYDFQCAECGERFEELVASSGPAPRCPACGAADPERLLGSFAGPFKIGRYGQAARRSNAVRAAREEQRRERKAQRQEQRQQG
jgi:putative FmdB family regulatory protein